MQLTLRELQVQQREQLDHLLTFAGGIAHLAKMLDIHYMVVKGWKERGRISRQGIELVENHPKLQDFIPAQLRPDLYD